MKARPRGLDAETLEETIIKSRVIADGTETIDPESNGGPTSAEAWLGYEQDNQKRLSPERFRLVENRKALCFKPPFRDLGMSKIGPPLARQCARWTRERSP